MKHTLTILPRTDGSATLIRVECRLTNSLPTITIVGVTHRSVSESKERIRGALAAYKIRLPAKRIIVNLSPADIPKYGSLFDLAILAAILIESRIVKHQVPSHTILLGEVGLDGSIRPIGDIIGAILAAKSQGITEFWIPQANQTQAQYIPGITCYAFCTINQVIATLNNTSHAPAPLHQIPLKSSQTTITDIIAGQDRAKRALIIAAAGHHHIVFIGPAGTGKSTLARQTPKLLPSMTTTEMLDVTRVHTIASKVNASTLIRSRPIQSPHHHISPRALLGASNTLRPIIGEIALAQHGVLLLDELPEYQRSVLECLREILDDETQNFLLVATANPCPCGNYKNTQAQCICSGAELTRYQSKLSGPLIDRIDLICKMEPLEHEQVTIMQQSSLSTSLSQIKQAQTKQLSRQGLLNGRIPHAQLIHDFRLTKSAKELLSLASTKRKLSARGHMQTVRVAQTIADLNGDTTINQDHIGEALQFISPIVQNSS